MTAFLEPLGKLHVPGGTSLVGRKDLGGPVLFHCPRAVSPKFSAVSPVPQLLCCPRQQFLLRDRSLPACHPPAVLLGARAPPPSLISSPPPDGSALKSPRPPLPSQRGTVSVKDKAASFSPPPPPPDETKEENVGLSSQAARVLESQGEALKIPVAGPHLQRDGLAWLGKGPPHGRM